VEYVNPDGSVAPPPLPPDYKDEIVIAVSDGKVLSVKATNQFSVLDHVSNEKTTLRYLPDGCFSQRHYLATGPYMNRIDHIVAELDLNMASTFLASAGGWTPGVPFDIYFRVDHGSSVPACPYDFNLSLPDFFQVQNAQGARVQDLGPHAATADFDGRPTQLLTWTVELKPGMPFERWVRVVPGMPPKGVEAVRLHATSPFGTVNPGGTYTARLDLPMTAKGGRVPPGSKLPTAVKPADTVPSRGCPMSGPQTINRDVRIGLSANPPVMRKETGYTTKIFANVKELPGRPIEDGLPLKLELVFHGDVATLADIKQTEDGLTATLSLPPGLQEKPRDLLLRATSKDGHTEHLIVAVDAVLLRGNVVQRPGDGTETPIEGAAVLAGPASGGPQSDTVTDAQGYFEIPAWTEGPYFVLASADGYIQGQPSEPVPASGGKSYLDVAPTVLVFRDEVTLATDRAKKVSELHRALLGGGLVARVLPAPSLPDPAAAGGAVPEFLRRLESGASTRPDSEEAVRRLSLALEVGQLGGRDSAAYASDIASAIYDDGVGMLTDLLSAITSAKELGVFKLGKLSEGSAQAGRLQEVLDVNLLPQQQTYKEKFVQALTSALQKYLLEGAVPSASTEAVAGAIADKVIDSATGRARQELENASQIDPEAEAAALDVLFATPAESLHREVKAAIAGVLSRSYIEMVYSELASAAADAVAGAPTGFAEGGYADAHQHLRANVQIIETTRHQVGFTPGDEALKTFVNGAISDYRAWGKALIIAVTGGQAIPVLARIEPAIDLISAIVKARRFAIGLDLMKETLMPGSIYWQAVGRGIRSAFHK